MKKNKNGFTTIELIATFALTLVIVVLLLQVIVVLKDVYINKVVVNSLRVKQAVMTEKIMDDFDNKNLEGTAGCVGVSNCISFIWEDGTVTELKLDKTKNTFSYADYVTELTGGSSFGNFIVTDSAVSSDGQRKYISFNFPIYSTFVKGDYGIHVIYQYNPKKNGINASSFGNTTDGPSLFVINGDNPTYITSLSQWSEPGYKAFYNNAWNTNPTITKKYYDINNTEVSGVQDKTVSPITTIKYTYTAPDGKVYTQTRQVIYKTYQYSYTAGYQIFTAAVDGYYKFEAWGASGGDIYGTSVDSTGATVFSKIFPRYLGGKGAYTSGTIFLKAKQKIYVYVGSAPTATNESMFFANTETGGYNGGASLLKGQGVFGAPGGGATDFRYFGDTYTPTTADLVWSSQLGLASRIMVAAGGGGADFRNQGYGQGDGGAGGGINGTNGSEALYPNTYWRSDYALGYGIGTGASQTAGGIYENHYLNGSVGIGDATISGTFGGANLSGSIQAGGGGGYYSGGNSGHGGAGGGSSYISGYTGCVAITSASSITPKSGCTTGTSDVTCSYHYSGMKFINTTMLSGNDGMPTQDGTSIITGNSGNGSAKVTFLGTSSPVVVDNSTSYAYTGSSQSFVVKTTGYYKLEVWGASGGCGIYTTTSVIGGYGSYSSGIVHLTSGTTLYVYVGQVGSDGIQEYTDNVSKTIVGPISYNGGGANCVNINCNWGGGGGATHISTANGILSSLSSNLSSVLLVAGGGGGAGLCQGSSGNIGGSGGGYTGDSGINTCEGAIAQGGNQSGAGTAGGNGGTGGFGYGGSGSGSGGGSGLYGGGGSWNCGTSAAGGSGYIGNSLLLSGTTLTKHMTCYNCTTSTDASTKTNTTTNVSATPIADYAKSGNGYARITYIGTTN